MVRWLRWHCPRALAVWGRARYLSVTESPHNTDFHTWMGKKHFCFFQTAETGNRTPNSGVKGSGANHYPRAHAHLESNLWYSMVQWRPFFILPSNTEIQMILVSFFHVGSGRKSNLLCSLVSTLNDRQCNLTCILSPRKHNDHLLLDHRLRRWPKNKSTSGHCLRFNSALKALNHRRKHEGTQR